MIYQTDSSAYPMIR